MGKAPRKTEPFSIRVRKLAQNFCNEKIRMNKIITTAGLLAIGSLCAEAQQIQTGKPWNVSATLRGFYDDNNLTLPDIADPEESWGVEVSPSAGLNYRNEQSSVGINYTYSMRWFEARDSGNFDHTHLVNLKGSHAFSERYKLDLTDSFVITREPTVLNETIIVIPVRGEGDATRNTAKASFSAQVAENSHIVLGYENQFWDFEEEGTASRSALLDRMEHLGSISFRHLILPKTTGIVQYQFGVTDYTADEALNGVPVALPGGGAITYRSNVRDNYSHFFLLGADHSFTPKFNVSVRGGVQFTDYHNADGLGLESDQWGPFADVNGTYAYGSGSYAQLGVRHQRTATDIGYTAGFAPTQDAEATTVYGSVSHKLAAKLTASLIGQYQHSTFQSGAADELSDDFLSVGINLAYDITNHLVGEVGYNYDHLTSDLADRGIVPGREYDRNRIYAGIRANF